MLDFEPHITSKIETMLNQWATLAPSGPINVYPWCHWLGFDVICEKSEECEFRDSFEKAN